MQIGFIGLGSMGAPMARNLAGAGHHVTGFDPVAAPVDGVSPAASAAEAAREAEVVITMLPDGASMLSVMAQVLPVMTAGATIIDCSTVDVADARNAAAQATAAGMHWLDAPVSGGVGGAAAGTLTFMVGGSQDAFDIARPLFDVMGQKAVLCGDAGAGQATKICNNMILGASMIATCEAFALADRLGLDRQAMYDVVSTSSGQSWSLTTYCPAPGIGPESPADRDYAPGFSAALMLKDLRLSQSAAAGSGAATPLGAAATELYREMVEEAGEGALDFSAMLRRLTQGGAQET